MRIPPASTVTALAFGLLLTACQAGSAGDGGDMPPSGDRPAAPAMRDVRPERPSDYVIRGEATYRERIKTPPGARLDVRLVDAGGDVLARASMPDVAGPPIPFALPYDAARVRPGGRYALRAELVGPDGEVWFTTPTPVPVVPGAGTPVEILLHRGGGADAVGSAGGSVAMQPVSHWECGDLGVMARRTAAAGTLELAANGMRWSLRAPDGGRRYADASGTAFQHDGTTARLALRGEPERDCVPARQPSPWNRALLAGTDFRAVGNEPGWYVEVDRETSPALQATLAYGEKQVRATRVETTATGFAGVDAQGQRVELAIERTPCTDGMSGQRFEATARLRAGGTIYEGCGAYLAD